MPEEPEIDTDKLYESIREELEHDGSALLTTALFAAIAAVMALLAGATVNEALVLKRNDAELNGVLSVPFPDFLSAYDNELSHMK